MADPTKRATPDDTQTRFIAEMDRELMGWADPVARLRAALDADELELYCQPILGLRAPGGYPLGEVLVGCARRSRRCCRPASSCRRSSTTG